MIEIIRRLDGEAVRVTELTMSSPSLDDVFLRATGHAIRDEGLKDSVMPWAASLQQADR